MKNEELEELLQKYLDQSIDESEVNQLIQYLKAHPEQLKQVSEHIAIERLLNYQSDYHNKDWFHQEVKSRLENNHDQNQFFKDVSKRIREIQQPKSIKTYTPVLFRVAAIFLFSICLIWLFREDTHLASVSQKVQAELIHQHQSIKNTTKLKKGHYKLNKGYIQLEFQQHTSIIAEAPCEFSLESNNKIDLHNGKFVVKIGANQQDFKINTPDTEIGKQNSEFAISVSQKGNTEVHVFNGNIETKHPQSQKPSSISPYTAIRFNDKQGEMKIDFDSSRFLREMPPLHINQRTTWTHWSFDEGKGNIAKDRGQNLKQSYHARFETHPKDQDGPQWIDGQFGKAVAFDGKNDYFQTDYEGIGGHQARTVSFWVKVPKDWTPFHGYGIIGWGSYLQRGNTWQISVNPQADQGPIGRLRIGTKDAQAVGSRDLRDGQWHHIAVVMYGGKEANVATHILMFIDGELEACSTKSIIPISTDTTSSSSIKVKMGRNVATHGKFEKPKGLWYFRGAIDEMYIFNIALSPHQIRHLMQHNTFLSSEDALVQQLP